MCLLCLYIPTGRSQPTAAAAAPSPTGESHDIHRRRHPVDRPPAVPVRLLNVDLSTVTTAADLVIDPDVNGFKYDDFERSADLIRSGETAMRAALPEMFCTPNP